MIRPVPILCLACALLAGCVTVDDRDQVEVEVLLNKPSSKTMVCIKPEDLPRCPSGRKQVVDINPFRCVMSWGCTR